MVRSFGPVLFGALVSHFSTDQVANSDNGKMCKEEDW